MLRYIFPGMATHSFQCGQPNKKDNALNNYVMFALKRCCHVATRLLMHRKNETAHLNIRIMSKRYVLIYIDVGMK